MAEYCSNICLTSGINTVCDTGMGGIVELAVSNWAPNMFIKGGSGTNLTYVTADINGGVCASTNNWFKFTFKRNTASMTSTATVDEANGVRFVQTELNFNMNHMNEEKHQLISELMKSPTAVVVHDTNNEYWALGIDEPVFFTAGEGTTGTNRTDANQYTVTLTDVSDEYPYPVRNGAAIMNSAMY